MLRDFLVREASPIVLEQKAHASALEIEEQHVPQLARFQLGFRARVHVGQTLGQSFATSLQSIARAMSARACGCAVRCMP